MTAKAKEPPNKINALFILCRTYAEPQNTTASARRIVKALRTLGFDDKEIIRYLHANDFCNPNGDAYSDKIKRVWP